MRCAFPEDVLSLDGTMDKKPSTKWRQPSAPEGITVSLRQLDTKQNNPPLISFPTEVEQEEDKTMDVTFVLEESGVTATVEVPCEADVAAAKEVACRALAVSPASVEMRIGTQVLEGTCRLQDTAFDAGVQVVLCLSSLGRHQVSC